MKFILEIELGNDAMCSNADVGAALREVATRITDEDADVRSMLQGHAIMDANGNRVGRWSVRR